MDNMNSRNFCDNNYPSLAIAYVAWQRWQNLYSPDVGFKRGTIFAELDKPFLGEEAVDCE